MANNRKKQRITSEEKQQKKLLKAFKKLDEAREDLEEFGFDVNVSTAGGGLMADPFGSAFTPSERLILRKQPAHLMPLMEQAVKRYSAEQLSFITKDFSLEQASEVLKGFDANLSTKDVALYASEELSPQNMALMRENLIIKQRKDDAVYTLTQHTLTQVSRQPAPKPFELTQPINTKATVVTDLKERLHLPKISIEEPTEPVESILESSRPFEMPAEKPKRFLLKKDEPAPKVNPMPDPEPPTTKKTKTFGKTEVLITIGAVICIVAGIGSYLLTNHLLEIDAIPLDLLPF